MKIETVTPIHDVISIDGQIILAKGIPINVIKVNMTEAFFGKATGAYYPEKIESIKLEGHEGVTYSPETFIETKRL